MAEQQRQMKKPPQAMPV